MISKWISSIDRVTHLELENNLHTNWDENNGFVFDFRIEEKTTRNELHVTFMAAIPFTFWIFLCILIRARPWCCPAARTHSHILGDWQFKCRRFLHLMTRISWFVRGTCRATIDETINLLRWWKGVCDSDTHTHREDQNHHNRSRAAGTTVIYCVQLIRVCVRQMIYNAIACVIAVFVNYLYSMNGTACIVCGRNRSHTQTYVWTFVIWQMIFNPLLRGTINNK